MSNHDHARAAMSLSEGAAYCGLGLTKFKELIQAKAIRTVRVGRRVLVPRREIEAFLEAEAK